MKLFYKKQNLINRLRKLKLIKADDSFKASLFERLRDENERFIPSVTEEYHFEHKQFFKKIFFHKTKPLFMPLFVIIIVVFIGAGAGITFASQSALPGEILYPIKIVSEKARIAIAASDDEKARLHFEFSSKRLGEVAELAKDSASDPKLAKIAVEGYKKELSEGQAVLFFAQNENEEKIERAADILADITSKNKEAIAKIGKETKNYKMADSLKDAWEDTIEHNDKAALITLSLSTSSPIIDLAMQKKVFNKIIEAENKIAEADKYLLKKEEKGIDISEAKIKISNAQELLDEAKDLIGQAEYESAFNKAKEAYKTAVDAQKIVEHFDGGDDDKDKLEIFNQPASIINQINIRERNRQDNDDEQLDRNKKIKYDNERKK